MEKTETTKIKGKFYPLQHEEWLKACKELSAGARDVLYYIRTADPYSNGIEVSAAAIARDMGVNRSTVSRALKELDAKGYAGVEILTAKVCITGKGLLAVDVVDDAVDAEMQPCCKIATASAKLQQPPQNCNSLRKIATHSAKLQQASPETVAAVDVQLSKTLKTYSDLLKTLSEATRESFEKFCMKKIESCPFKIGSRKAWLNKHGEEYLEEFKELYSETLSSGVITPKQEFAFNPDIDYLKKAYGPDWEAAAVYYGLISPNSPTVENEEVNPTW